MRKIKEKFNTKKNIEICRDTEDYPAYVETYKNDKKITAIKSINSQLHSFKLPIPFE